MQKVQNQIITSAIKSTMSDMYNVNTPSKRSTRLCTGPGSLCPIGPYYGLHSALLTLLQVFTIFAIHTVQPSIAMI